MTQTHAWDRLPQETPKAFKAFQMYMLMPVYGEGEDRRGLENLARKLGLKSITSVAKWSTNFKWQERVAAYDAQAGTHEITVRSVAMADFQQGVVDNLSIKLVVMNEVLDKALGKLREKALNEVEVDSMELTRLAAVIEKVDNLSRRLAGMPTNYTTDTGEDIDEETIFTIRGS